MRLPVAAVKPTHKQRDLWWCRPLIACVHTASSTWTSSLIHETSTIALSSVGWRRQQQSHALLGQAYITQTKPNRTTPLHCDSHHMSTPMLYVSEALVVRPCCVTCSSRQCTCVTHHSMCWKRDDDDDDFMSERSTLCCAVLSCEIMP